MAKIPSSLLPLLLTILPFVLSMAVLGSAAVREDNQSSWKLERTSSDQCTGSLIECLEADELETGTEVNRRMLITTQYISYGAMQANRVPCSARGNSYYNCLPGASANPYERACSCIARCGRY